MATTTRPGRSSPIERVERAAIKAMAATVAALRAEIETVRAKVGFERSKIENRDAEIARLTAETSTLLAARLRETAAKINAEHRERRLREALTQARRGMETVIIECGENIFGDVVFAVIDDALAGAAPAAPTKPTICIGWPTINELRRGRSVVLSDAVLIPASDLRGDELVTEPAAPAAPEPCPACKGEGAFRTDTGGNHWQSQCEACGGRGITKKDASNE